MVEVMGNIITHTFKNQRFYFTKTPTAPALVAEIFNDNYHVLEGGVEFKANDVILDVGANEGMFAIMMAKLFPMTRVIAIEPIPATYFHLVRNKGLNNCKNIETYNIGFGKSGQHTTTMNVAKSFSGGSTSFCTYNPNDHYQVEVGLISMDDAFDLYHIERCWLLKMDIEGMEYDVLYSAAHSLSQVDNMAIEIHINQQLEFQSRRADALAVWLSNQTNLVHVDFCRMAE